VDLGVERLEQGIDGRPVLVGGNEFVEEKRHVE
jgi:hypothetical protein